jgi:hypothetical protein
LGVGARDTGTSVDIQDAKDILYRGAPHGITATHQD